MCSSGLMLHTRVAVGGKCGMTDGSV